MNLFRNISKFELTKRVAIAFFTLLILGSFFSNLIYVTKRNWALNRGYTFIEGGVFKCKPSTKGRIDFYYLYEKDDSVYSGRFTNQGGDCNYLTFGQKHLLRVANSDPQYSMEVKSLTGKLKNMDSLLVEYVKQTKTSKD